MRKLIFLAIILIAVSSCGNGDTEGATEHTRRIKVVEHQGLGNHAIIEIDGHEYLTNYHGGIIHLESCKCNTKNQ
jgi:hypothetical protein